MELHLTLRMVGDDEPMFDGDDVPAFCAALRAARLKKVSLAGVSLWGSLDNGLAVLAACTGHKTIEELNLARNVDVALESEHVVGAALAALVSADSALRSLSLAGCQLVDESVVALFAALARSTRLHTLDCRDNRVSQVCVRNNVLPAVQANESLRSLTLARQYEGNYCPEVRQVVALVRARAAAKDVL